MEKKQENSASLLGGFGGAAKKSAEMEVLRRILRGKYNKCIKVLKRCETDGQCAMAWRDITKVMQTLLETYGERYDGK